MAGGTLLAGCANQVAPFFASSKGGRSETSTIRLPSGFATCIAPQVLAVDMLRAEGLDVKHVPVTSDAEVIPAVSAGDIDMAMQTAPITVARADTNSGFVHVAGIHVGCFELFAQAGTRSINDLRGKRVAVFGDSAHVFTAAMAAYIGLDPTRDLTLVTEMSGDAALQLFVDGKVDAFMGGPSQPQQLRKMGLGHVLVSVHTDRPWSQQFCCVLIANRDFVQNNPVAAKQTIRGVLKAADICAQDPSGAAQRLLDQGHITDKDAAIQMFTHDASYHRWREYDPEDTIRFYGLLLHQIGMVKTHPNQLVAQSTDWRFLNELKLEMKA